MNEISLMNEDEWMIWMMNMSHSVTQINQNKHTIDWSIISIRTSRMNTIWTAWTLYEHCMNNSMNTMNTVYKVSMIHYHWCLLSIINHRQSSLIQREIIDELLFHRLEILTSALGWCGDFWLLHLVKGRVWWEITWTMWSCDAVVSTQRRRSKRSTDWSHHMTRCHT